MSRDEVIEWMWRFILVGIVAGFVKLGFKLNLF